MFHSNLLHISAKSQGTHNQLTVWPHLFMSWWVMFVASKWCCIEVFMWGICEYIMISPWHLCGIKFFTVFTVNRHLARNSEQFKVLNSFMRQIYLLFTSMLKRNMMHFDSFFFAGSIMLMEIRGYQVHVRSNPSTWNFVHFQNQNLTQITGIVISL